MARAAGFFQDMFGWPLAAGSLDTPRDPAVLTDPYQLFGGAVLQATPDLLVGLRPALEPGNRNDHPQQTGMDHLSLRVPSLADLDHAHAALHRYGVRRGNVTPWPELRLAFMGVEGPDNLPLELSLST